MRKDGKSQQRSGNYKEEPGGNSRTGKYIRKCGIYMIGFAED